VSWSFGEGQVRVQVTEELKGRWIALLA